VTTPDPTAPREPDARVGTETLELRARPQPVTRINRKVLIGSTAVLLLMMSGIVLVALKPPSLRVASPQELFNVDHKPITDTLSKLPATYDGVRPNQKTDAGKNPASLTPGVRQLTEPASDPVAEAERVEKARLARMAGQARESQVFFRLQLKAPPREAVAAEPRPEPIARPTTIMGDGSLTTLSALRAAERVRAIATGDLDGLANDNAADQTRKLSFLKSGPEKEIYNPHRLQKPASPYQLMAGTIIAASLVSGLNSDLPGFVIAQVTENVYDTVSGQHLLVPQGARLIGKYDNIIAFGQERALVVWQRIILPDGSSIVIDNLPATDTGGYAGLADEVDLHTWKLLKGVALATVLGVGSQLAFGSSDSDLVKALQQSTQSTTNRAGQRLVERNLNVQPTITVRPGWPLRVIVHKDIVLRPYPGPSSQGNIVAVED
jgi:type IV secretion system protein TrbI